MAAKKPLPAYELPNNDPVPDWAAGDAYLDSIKPAPPAPPQAGVLRTVGDMGIKAAQGVVDYGKSVVMVTHDPKAAGFASRQLHMDKGSLLDAGSPP